MASLLGFGLTDNTVVIIIIFLKDSGLTEQRCPHTLEDEPVDRKP